MKYICLFVCVLVAVVCIQGQGIPTRQCPPGEHSVLYCPRMAEPDCDTPSVHARPTLGACDVPDCFCDKGTVRHLGSGKCVPPSQCSC